VIPPFNHSYVLPPFQGAIPTAAAMVSPYTVSMLDLVQRFAHLPSRRPLLMGLLDYRLDLKSLGFKRGFQWLDGSFVEDVEAAEKRPPNDIDLVTFSYSPEGLTSTQINQLLIENPTLFVAVKAKVKYGCDAYVVPLDKSPEALVKRTAYYFQLFSHRRGDHIWKGVLQVPLESDDTQARELLDNLSMGGSNVATT
jgi:hypothetical protein